MTDRLNRSMDDNYCDTPSLLPDIETRARHLGRITGRRQMVHPHPHGHLCTAACHEVKETT